MLVVASESEAHDDETVGIIVLALLLGWKFSLIWARPPTESVTFVAWNFATCVVFNSALLSMKMVHNPVGTVLDL